MKKKHIDFCEEYLSNGYDVMEAYKTVYRTENGMNGYKLMKRDDIKIYLDERIEELYENKRIKAKIVAMELTNIAFMPLDKLNDNITCSQKLKALELLQKQLGLHSQKLEVEETKVIFFEGEDLLED